MTIKTVPHLNFRGQARDALKFYQTVFGGDLMVVTYNDLNAVQDPTEADQVIWGQVAASNGFQVMAYDVPSRLSYDPGEMPFFVSVRGDAAEEISDFWGKLSDGATILAPSGWSPLYGMLKVRFGVTFVLDVAVAHPAG